MFKSKHPGAIIDAGISLLETIEEGKTGLRLLRSNPLNHGRIGEWAIDISTQTENSETSGATGDYSFAKGYNTTASGEASSAEGKSNTPEVDKRDNKISVNLDFYRTKDMWEVTQFESRRVDETVSGVMEKMTLSGASTKPEDIINFSQSAATYFTLTPGSYKVTINSPIYVNDYPDVNGWERKVNTYVKYIHILVNGTTIEEFAHKEGMA